MEFYVFKFVSIAFCPVGGHYWEESIGLCFAPSYQVFIHIVH